MKRLNRRVAITLVLVAGLLTGMVFFCVQLFRNGNDWVASSAPPITSPVPSMTARA